MLDNFAYLIQKIGFISNSNRHYYENRSEPSFFSLMPELVIKQMNMEMN
jgi:alpha,alpha-trehalase